MGLAAFGSADSDHFFGRDRLVDKLVSRLRQRRLVAVIGASRSGKSSLLFAGLLPALRKYHEERGAELFTLHITPGTHPLQECAVRLGAELRITSSQLVRDFADRPENLALAIRQVIAKRPSTTDSLLIIDQFEELFTLCREVKDRDQFIAALLAVTTDPSCAIRVVLGLRADFYGHCAQHRQLADAVEDAQVLVGPMNIDELRQAITQPALRSRCTVEAALLAQLVSDAAGHAGALPLVSHALLETWRRRKGNALTIAGYDAVGGIHRAIARSAENAYSLLDSDGQQMARLIFLRLAAPGDGTEDTKRRVRRGELDNDNPRTRLVLEHLVAARLITLDGDSVDLTHEALIRSWPRLHDWLAEDREGLRIHRRLTDATDAWESLQRDPGALYRGTRLATTQQWATSNDTALTPRERAFLQASVAAQHDLEVATLHRTRRIRRLAAVLTSALIIAAAATGFAVSSQQAASQQRNTALAQKLIRDAGSLREANPALAAQLTLAAHKIAPNRNTYESLLSTFAKPYATLLPRHNGPVFDVAISSDRRTVATATRQGQTKMWDTTNPHKPIELPAFPAEGHWVEFSPQGHLAATLTSEASGARLWDMKDPRRPQPLADLGRTTIYRNSVAFSPVKHLVAIVTAEPGPAKLLDITDPRHPAPLGFLDRGIDGPPPSRYHDGALVFGPDGKLLAVIGHDRLVRLWDVTDPTRPAFLSTLNANTDIVAFSPDGKTLATNGSNRKIGLWNIADPRAPSVISELPGHAAAVNDIAFSPDGGTIASASDDQTIRLWDITYIDAPGPPTTLVGHSGAVHTVAFSSDGRTLISGGEDPVVRIWDIFPFSHRMGFAGRPIDVTFALDGKVVAIAVPGGVRTWNLAEGELSARGPATIGRRYWLGEGGSPGEPLIARANNQVLRWSIDDSYRPQLVGSLTGEQATVDSRESLLLVRIPATDRRIHQNDRRQPDGGSGRVARGPLENSQIWDVSDPYNPQMRGVLPIIFSSSSFSANGRLLATTREGDKPGDPGDPTIIWDIQDSAHPSILSTLPTTASVAFSPTEPILAMTNRDGGSRLLDVSDPRNPTELCALPAGPITPDRPTHLGQTASFSPDGNILATIGGDNTTRLLDISDARQPREIVRLNGHSATLNSVTYSPDGHTIVTTGEDNSLLVWETDPDRLAKRICSVAYPRITSSEWNHYTQGEKIQPPCS
ncbi:MAG TPA: hypothetical protein VFV67_00455 [Actinophytocola sp.]|uniref:nSTAND1 domain-containing NTPase n=1 Tax=Actinophytocola sp. TaxID=1872138 RepID=UPI002DBB29CC|nr:hypothetical protein [Actinophytocola sp.]HEU5469093.1 hypothetical protein [Actinophytocola sp.]